MVKKKQSYMEMMSVGDQFYQIALQNRDKTANINLKRADNHSNLFI